MLETLYNGSSSWKSVTPTSLPATTFTGDITLGVNGISYTNSVGTPKTISQAMLETLYTGSSTWLSVTPTSLPATTFTGDITCNSQIKLQSSTLTLPILEYVISSYNSWIDGLTLSLIHI